MITSQVLHFNIKVFCHDPLAIVVIRLSRATVNSTINVTNDDQDLGWQVMAKVSGTHAVLKEMTRTSHAIEVTIRSNGKQQFPRAKGHRSE